MHSVVYANDSTFKTLCLSKALENVIATFWRLYLPFYHNKIGPQSCLCQILLFLSFMYVSTHSLWVNYASEYQLVEIPGDRTIVHVFGLDAGVDGLVSWSSRTFSYYDEQIWEQSIFLKQTNKTNKQTASALRKALSQIQLKKKTETWSFI